jgi:hypothetical protein
MPVPGNLREQSKPYARGKIAERRWGGVFSAYALRFVTVDNEALNFSDFAHSFERLAVGFDEILPMGHVWV